jgi:hypothetical protein
MCVPVLDGRSWVGDCDAGGMEFTIELWPTIDGYYNYSAVCLDDGVEFFLKRGMKAEHVIAQLEKVCLRTWELRLWDFTWQEVESSSLCSPAHLETMR